VYIANDYRRFHVFVANRVQQIRDQTEPFQWNYILSAENPTYIASRGASPVELKDKRMWYRGPDFLRESSLPFAAHTPSVQSLSDDDPEVKRCQVFDIKVEPTEYGSLLDYLNRYSDWTQAKRVIAHCMRFNSLLLKILHREMVDDNDHNEQGLTVQQLEEAESCIVKLVQSEAFKQ
jgi:hypothetical protein